jgi:hypothetical protein
MQDNDFWLHEVVARLVDYQGSSGLFGSIVETHQSQHQNEWKTSIFCDHQDAKRY